MRSPTNSVDITRSGEKRLGCALPHGASGVRVARVAGRPLSAGAAPAAILRATPPQDRGVRA
eukprot:4032117-Prymnesium_polylepis.1